MATCFRLSLEHLQASVLQKEVQSVRIMYYVLCTMYCLLCIMY